MIRVNDEAVQRAASTVSRSRYLSVSVTDAELVRQAVIAYEEAHPNPRRMGPPPRQHRRPDEPTRIAP